MGAVGAPGGPRRRRHGRLGDRRRAGPRRARRHGLAADPRPRAYGLPPWTTPDTTVLCASYSGDTEETLACYEAAGALGATRVVATSGGRLAELARADGVPVIPVAGGLQPRAAVAYMTVAALEVAARCGAGPRCASEIDVAAEHLEELVVEWGPEAAEDARPRRWRAASRDGAGHRRRRADDADRLPLEDAAQREREGPGVLRTSCPSSTTTSSSAGPARPSSARFAAVFLEDSDTHPRIADRVELTAALIARAAAAHVPRADARRRRRRARVLARAARRPRVALPGGAARRRPGPGRASSSSSSSSWPSVRRRDGGRRMPAPAAGQRRGMALIFRLPLMLLELLLRRLFRRDDDITASVVTPEAARAAATPGRCPRRPGPSPTPRPSRVAARSPARRPNGAPPPTAEEADRAPPRARGRRARPPPSRSRPRRCARVTGDAGHVDREAEIVESFGPADDVGDVGGTITVDEPWDGLRDHAGQRDRGPAALGRRRRRRASSPSTSAAHKNRATVSARSALTPGLTPPPNLDTIVVRLGASMDALTIHEAAETTGWSPRMLRYIERNGLIEPQRSAAGYRLYGAGRAAAPAHAQGAARPTTTSASATSASRYACAASRSCATRWRRGSRPSRSVRTRSPPPTG